MNSESEKSLVFEITIIAFIVFSVIAFAIGCHAGEWAGKLSVQQEAVKNGAAVWSVDDNGSVQFTWKETKEKENE